MIGNQADYFGRVPQRMLELFALAANVGGDTLDWEDKEWRTVSWRSSKASSRVNTIGSPLPDQVIVD